VEKQWDIFTSVEVIRRAIARPKCTKRQWRLQCR